MLERLMLINGEWVPASDGAVKQSVNPATGEVLGTAPLATHEDVERALDAAHRHASIGFRHGAYAVICIHHFIVPVEHGSLLTRSEKYI